MGGMTHGAGERDPKQLEATVLTERELEIAGLARQRMSAKEIADQLSVSISSVHTHLTAIRKKGISLPRLPRSVRSSANANTSKGLSIQATAKQVGITAANLRILEMRYGWPEPERRSNGYRVYPHDLVKELERFKFYLDQGYKPGDLIFDGAVQWPDEPSNPYQGPSRDARSIDKLAEPANPRCKRYFQDARSALAIRNVGKLHELLERGQMELRLEEVGGAILVPILYGLIEQNLSADSIGRQDTIVLERVGQVADSLRHRLSRSEERKAIRPDDGVHPAVISAVKLGALQRGISFEVDDEHEDDDALRLRCGRGVGRGGPFGIWIGNHTTLADLFDPRCDLHTDLLPQRDQAVG